MRPGPQAQEVSEWADEYVRVQNPVMLDLEKAVCGCDYGGTSWTTREEADRIARLLELRAGTKLLEIGAGSGWPALYLAGKSGCDTTLSDVPFEAIRLAADRVERESLDGEISLVVADGAALPFEADGFDAISHSDVLCCLAPKREVLHECRRVIRSGGKMIFTVIYVAQGLSRAEHARAVEAGPPYVETESGYPELLETSGWSVVDRIDISSAYEETGRRHIREVEARAGPMSELLGAAELEDLLVRRRRNVEAVAEGIVRRDLYVASPLDVG